MIPGKTNPFDRLHDGKRVVDGISDQAVENMERTVRGTQSSPATAFEDGNPDFSKEKDGPHSRGACSPSDIISHS